MFRDRTDAGRRLGEELAARWRGRPGPRPNTALALPRGGVPVAREVAQVLGLGLDVLVIRKIGVPWQPELALGAVGETGPAVFNDQVVEQVRLPRDRVEELVARARQEATALAAELRGRTASAAEPGGQVPAGGLRPALVVDDGVATGATARAAAALLRAAGAPSVTLAAPVCPGRVVAELEDAYDEVVVVHAARRFGSVGEWYDRFEQVGTREVRGILSGVS
ncbi:MAG TPA: phosphoribosyltransferase [Segeticoccus sp.]|nr:phosphoribosyltransferase [Segeticoccus sp.]